MSPAESPSPEPLSSSDIEKQWQTQVQLHSTLGLLSIDTATKQLGISGIDGKHHPIPTWKEIEVLLQKPEYQDKIEQGFTKLLLTPFALPLERFIEALKVHTLEAYKGNHGKLISTDGTELSLNEGEPVWVWDQYKDADLKGTLLYFPRALTKERHGGTTKLELLKSADAAWNITLIEETPDVPREGRGRTVANRRQIESNKTPNEYVSLLSAPAYHHESGLTPEDEIVYALHHLIDTNRVIDDWSGTGSVIYLTGAWFPSSGCVSSFGWSRVLRQWNVGRFVPANRSSACGFRPGVRVK